MFETKNSQQGGVTIMVTLMLLVLLTVAALSMSKNSFKEISTTGFLRQGAMARNVADSGIQWGIYWIDTATGAEKQSSRFIEVKNELARNNEHSGVPWGLGGSGSSLVDFASGGSLANLGVTLDDDNPESGYVQGFTIGLTRMGKLPIANMSQGAGAGAYTPASGGQMLQAPDLWAIRSEAQVKPKGSSITFTHTKEAWVTTPVR
jgi:hypothetical protein